MNIMESRMVSFANSYEAVDRMVTIPQPSPYVNLCYMLVSVFIMSYPLEVNVEEGIWANVILPWCICLSMIGLSVVAQELENPVGDDTTDLNLLEMVHALEVE